MCVCVCVCVCVCAYAFLFCVNSNLYTSSFTNIKTFFHEYTKISF